MQAMRSLPFVIIIFSNTDGRCDSKCPQAEDFNSGGTLPQWLQLSICRDNVQLMAH